MQGYCNYGKIDVGNRTISVSVDLAVAGSTWRHSLIQQNLSCCTTQELSARPALARTTTTLSMTFWQENYSFIREVYDTRYCKMVEWMDNVEMAIQKVCASKVYTSAEFKREKDNFHVSFPKPNETKTISVVVSV